MSSTNSSSQITKLILELHEHQDRTLLTIPSFKHTEIAAIENTLRNCKTGLRTVITSQRILVEDILEKISFKEAEIEELNEISQLESEGSDTLLKREETNLKDLRNALRLNSEAPNAAIAIEISKIQQLRRGLNIYKYVRIKRIINILLHDLLLAARNSDQSTSVMASFRPKAQLLEKCSRLECKLIEALVDALRAYGFEESFRSLPFTVSCGSIILVDIIPPVAGRRSWERLDTAAGLVVRYYEILSSEDRCI